MLETWKMENTKMDDFLTQANIYLGAIEFTAEVSKAEIAFLTI